MSRYQMMLLAGAAVLIAGSLLWRSGAAGNEHVVDVKVPELSSISRQGEALFDANCVACHGKNAGGSANGPPLVHIYYESGHHGDGAFYFAALRGVRQHHWNFGNMPPVVGIKEDDVKRIIAYIRQLQRHNGIN